MSFLPSEEAQAAFARDVARLAELTSRMSISADRAVWSGIATFIGLFTLAGSVYFGASALGLAAVMLTLGGFLTALLQGSIFYRLADKQQSIVEFYESKGVNILVVENCFVIENRKYSLDIFPARSRETELHGKTPAAGRPGQSASAALLRLVTDRLRGRIAAKTCVRR